MVVIKKNPVIDARWKKKSDIPDLAIYVIVPVVVSQKNKCESKVGNKETREHPQKKKKFRVAW